MPAFDNPVFCALDVNERSRARSLARLVRPHVGGLKIGMEAFYSLGQDGYADVAAERLPIFLDLKLHDIPNTVAGAVRALADLSPSILNIHASGGMAMMRAAREARDEAGAVSMRLIGVTVLTSLDDADLAEQGIAGSAADQALRLAELTRKAGLDGVVCSPHDARRIKDECGEDFLTVVPGIRPAAGDIADQKRVLGPREAREAGADILVIGRPITAAPAPAEAAATIAEALAA